MLCNNSALIYPISRKEEGKVINCTNKVVGIMQPTYLPWTGYFELISRSNVFVFLDDVQFVKKSWHQRNRINGPNGPFWLTVPVLHKGKQFQNINEVNINNDINWPKKHLNSIKVSYLKSPCFEEYISDFENLYNKTWYKLGDLNIAFIRMLMDKIGLDMPVLCSSSMNISCGGNEKVLEICKLSNADELYDAAGAVEVIDDAFFENAGIKVTYQEYTHPEYKQLYGKFTPYMSVIDLLFNEGPKSLDIIRSGAK